MDVAVGGTECSGEENHQVGVKRRTDFLPGGTKGMTQEPGIDRAVEALSCVQVDELQEVRKEICKAA